jgi:hypothetical protein
LGGTIPVANTTAVLASDGTEYVDALCTTHECRPLVPINADGSVDSAGLVAAQSYYEVMSRARAALAIREETPP